MCFTLRDMATNQPPRGSFAASASSHEVRFYASKDPLLGCPRYNMPQVFFAVAMLAIMPLALSVGWLVFCSRPVQCRIWMPSVFWAVIRSSYVNKVHMYLYC